ncbi:MAG: patatin-like phospholipase family protein [Acidobacteriia bacterium]|nr:patatin-like phospholipase family protein [Terriglobia bacterium]
MLTVSKRRALRIFQTLMLMQFFSAVTLPAQGVTQPRKRIGLALSGGGARGAAHIGVLKVLEREGIKIDCIAGTSFGSIVGGLFAAGYSADEIETFITANWQDIFSNQPERARAPLLQGQNLRQLAHLNLQGLNPSLPLGFLGGQKLTELLNQYTLESMLAAGYDFDRLPIPFRAVATDLLTGAPYIFKRGSLSEAIRASISQPVIFTPVNKDGMLLVDGGLADNLPADIPAEMGADIVIAVDVTSPSLEVEEVRNAFNVIDQSLGLLTQQTVRPHDKYAQLVVRPDLNGYFHTSYARMPEIIQRGVSAAEANIDKIRALVGPENLNVVERRRPAVVNTIIDSITFETTSRSRLQKIPTSYFLRQIASRPGDKIVPEKLSIDIARLYATGMFEKVDYECQLVGENRYSLIYHLTESSPNSLGVSLRYDREYRLQALTEFSARDLFGTTSYGTFSGRFGETGYETVSLRLIYPKLPFLFLEPQGQILTRERFERSVQQGTAPYVDKRGGAQLMLGMRRLGRFEASVGYRFEMERFVPKDVSHPNVPRYNLSGLRMHVRRDTLDAQEFPRSGMNLEFQVDSRSPKFGADVSYNVVQADFQQHFSPTGKTTITLRLAGLKSGGALPPFERAYLGGYGFSDSGSYRLVGFERDELVVPKMAIAGVGYRYQLFAQPLSFMSRGYLSVEYNLAGIGKQPGITIYAGTVHGGAVGLVFDTMLGPVRLAAGIGQAGKLRLYLSLGPSF